MGGACAGNYAQESDPKEAVIALSGEWDSWFVAKAQDCDLYEEFIPADTAAMKDHSHHAEPSMPLHPALTGHCVRSAAVRIMALFCSLVLLVPSSS